MLALATALAIAACGSSSKSSSGSSGSDPASSTTSAASGSTTSIKLGFVTTLSNNPFSDVGVQAKAAFQAALAQSSSYDVKVTPYIEDDQGDPQQAVQVCQKLIEQDHVQAIVGVMLTPNKNACTVLAQKAGVPLIAGQQSAPNCSSLYFQTGWVPNQVITPALDYLAKQGTKKLYFVGNDYAFDTEILADLKKAAAAHGMTVVGDSLPPIGTTNWSPIFSRVVAAHPDAVVDAMVDEIDYQKQAALDPSMKALHRVSLALDEAQLHAAGGNQTGLHFITQYVSSQKNPANATFLAALKKANPSVIPSLTSENLYNATLVAMAAAKQGGSSASGIAKAIPNVTVETPGGTLSMDGAHNPTLTGYVAQVGNGLSAATVATTKDVAPQTGCAG
jgi:urea transport system substrate-binding protein